MEFKDLIKQRRKELNLTLEDIAKVVGVSKATVQRWESGEIANVRRDKIAKLAVALHTSPSYLMGWDNEEGNLDELDRKKQKLMNLINSIDDEKKLEIINKFLNSILE